MTRHLPQCASTGAEQTRTLASPCSFRCVWEKQSLVWRERGVGGSGVQGGREGGREGGGGWPSAVGEYSVVHSPASHTGRSSLRLIKVTWHLQPLHGQRRNLAQGGPRSVRGACGAQRTGSTQSWMPWKKEYSKLDPPPGPCLRTCTPLSRAFERDWMLHVRKMTAFLLTESPSLS